MFQFARTAGPADRVSMAIWTRDCPAIAVKFPMTSSLVPSGETSSSWTLVVPPLNRPVTDTLTSESTAPVTESTAAILVRVMLLTFTKEPPRTTLFPHRAMSLIAPPAEALKAVIRAPVVGFSFAMRVAAVPATDVNVPAMMMLPSGATSIEVMVPLAFGLKAVSTTPVVALNARMRLRVMFVELPWFRTVVKVPAAIIRLPTCTMALTGPFWICGVKFTGLGLTTCACACWNASPTPLLATSIVATSVNTANNEYRSRRGTVRGSRNTSFRGDGGLIIHPGHDESYPSPLD